ncbi:MAG: hypothetical protein ACE147_00630 [Candidatus Methylomirabilales bacterium]
MLEQVSQDVTFYAFFTASKQGKTGLSPTVDVYNPAGTKIVSDGVVTELGGGLYSYVLASGSTATEGEYTAVFKTADSTVDQQHVPSLWVIGRAGIEDLDALVSSRLAAASYTAPDNATIAAIAAAITTNLDVAISTRLAAAGYTAPDSAATIAAAVWASGVRTLTSFGTLVADLAAAVWAYVTRSLTDKVGFAPSATQNASAVLDVSAADHKVPGTVGAKINQAGSAADPLENLVPGSYTAGTAGAALGRIGSGQIVTSSPVASSGAVTIVRGNDYAAADGRALTWTDAGGTWPNLTGATVRLRVAGLSVTGTVVQATGPGIVRVELTAEQTAAQTPRVRAPYDLEATLSSGRVVTLVRGHWTVLADVPAAGA